MASDFDGWVELCKSAPTPDGSPHPFRLAAGRFDGPLPLVVGFGLLPGSPRYQRPAGVVDGLAFDGEAFRAHAAVDCPALAECLALGLLEVKFCAAYDSAPGGFPAGFRPLYFAVVTPPTVNQFVPAPKVSAA